jgi:tetratricopeptide (TPR) repeat protein
VSDQWTNAHILRAQQNIAANQYKEALLDLQTAVTVPDNLPARGSAAARNAEIAYLTGLAFEGLGDSAKATASWNRATAPAQSGAGLSGGGRGGAQSYYQALCLQKLGQADKAKAIFQSLMDSGELALKQQTSVESGRGGAGQSPRLRSANAHYMIGLGYLGLGDPARAKAELAQAVELSPDLLGAHTALAALKQQ